MPELQHKTLPIHSLSRLGRIIVDRNGIGRLAHQRVPIGRKVATGLALAGLHFYDIALMQEDAALKLGVEGAGQARPRLAAVGEASGSTASILRPDCARFLGRRCAADRVGVGRRLNSGSSALTLPPADRLILPTAVIGGAKDLFLKVPGQTCLLQNPVSGVRDVANPRPPEGMGHCPPQFPENPATQARAFPCAGCMPACQTVSTLYACSRWACRPTKGKTMAKPFPCRLGPDCRARCRISGRRADADTVVATVNGEVITWAR